MRYIFETLMSLAIVFGTSTSAFATSYFVSLQGADSNDCLSLAKACRSIQVAAYKTRPGDFVVVNGGEYRGGFMVPYSGTANAHITYIAYPGTTPVLVLSGADWWGIAIPPGTSYVDISGFRVIGTAQTLSLPQAQALAQSRTLIPSNGQSCIAIGGDNNLPPAHHIVVYNNETSYCPGAGIYTAHADYITVINNRVHDNGWWNWLGPSGISLYEHTNSDSNTGYKNFIVNNFSYSNIQKVGHPELGITDGNGIVIDKSLNSDGNKIPYKGRTYIANNVVYLNGGNGIIAYLSEHVDIVNNSTYSNNMTVLNRGEIQANLSRDIVVLNNILYAAGNKAVVVDGVSTQMVWDYNIVYGGNRLDFWGPHDAWLNPNYLSPQAGLFQVLAMPGPLGNGTFTYAPSTDIVGVSRQGHIVRGAYQSF